MENQLENQTINNSNSIFEDLFKKHNYETQICNSELSKKDLLINSINNEIKIYKKRTNFELLKLKDDRKENRFMYKELDNHILFNLKCKGKIIILPFQKTKKTKSNQIRVVEYLKCENKIDSYIEMLINYRNSIKLINENDVLFNQITK